MRKNLILSALAAAALSAHATEMAAIVAKVTENCDKIESYAADALVRYKI